MIVHPNPQHLAQSDLDKIDSCVVSTPATGEFKVKKLRLNTDRQEIMVTHSSAAEP